MKSSPLLKPGKYNIIYADPPWSYRNYSYSTTKAGDRAVRGVEKEYPTMSIADISGLPISDLAADDSILFLWATWPNLEGALDVMKSWGFRYYTVGFVWVKTTVTGKLFWGMGNMTRSNTEPCLIGVKGKPRRYSASVHSVLTEQVGRHSQKPAIVRDKIVELCGDLPRIELFAREKVEGWDSWGNEVESDVGLEVPA